MMIRMFTIEKQAEDFAREHGGTIAAIRYDWDELTDKMVKYFIVRF